MKHVGDYGRSTTNRIRIIRSPTSNKILNASFKYILRIDPIKRVLIFFNQIIKSEMELLVERPNIYTR